MADYSLAALGQVVKRLRQARGLTQEELGTGAGYQGGAGVSISRLENGRLEPTPERFAGIARALGVTPNDLEARAAQESVSEQRPDKEGSRTREERMAAILRASERRNQIAPAISGFNEARERAERTFLMRFRAMASRVTGAPTSEPTRLPEFPTAEAGELKAEVAYQIQFTQYGVSRALAEGAGGVVAGVGGAAAYRAFTEAVALGTAPLGATVPRLAGAAAALNGLRAAMGVGRSATRFGGASTGINLLAAVAAGTVVAAVLDRQATSTRRRKEKEFDEKLAAAEADIAANQANVEVLLDIVPRAADVLDYVAVHASHALERWGTTLDEDTVPWSELGEHEQQRYRDFVAIAAAQLTVATLDLPELATSRDGELEQAAELADAILIQSQRAIASRV